MLNPPLINDKGEFAVSGLPKDSSLSHAFGISCGISVFPPGLALRIPAEAYPKQNFLPGLGVARSDDALAPTLCRCDADSTYLRA